MPETGRSFNNRKPSAVPHFGSACSVTLPALHHNAGRRAESERSAPRAALLPVNALLAEERLGSIPGRGRRVPVQDGLPKEAPVVVGEDFFEAERESFVAQDA